MCLTGLRRMSTAQMAALGLQRAAECMPPGLLRNPTADCSTTHSSNSSAARAFLISSYLCVTISWPPRAILGGFDRVLYCKIKCALDFIFVGIQIYDSIARTSE